MVAGYLAGVPLAWHGARDLVNSNEVGKRLSQKDVDAGFAGGAAGAGGYQLGMYSTKPLDRHYNRKLQQLDDDTPGVKGARHQLKEHEKASGFEGSRPPQGDPRWLKYNRTYPQGLPGWKLRRFMSYAHGGKTGVAATAVTGGVAAGASIAASRHKGKQKTSGNVAKFQNGPDDSRKRAVTAGLSATGAAAGAAGLGYAGYKLGQEFKEAPKALGTVRRLRMAAGKEKFATGLIPLEVAGLGGELMATKILHEDTKKQHVAKSASLVEVSKWNPMSALRLTRSAATGAHVMTPARTEQAIQANRTARRYQDVQARATNIAQRSANKMTPTGQTIGQRMEAVNASRAKRMANGTPLGNSDIAARNARLANRDFMGRQQFRAQESWNGFKPETRNAIRTGVKFGAPAVAGVGAIGVAASSRKPSSGFEGNDYMSKSMFDQSNGKGRRIVVENAESAEENKEENSVPVTRKKLLAMAADVKNGASMKSESQKESAVGKSVFKPMISRSTVLVPGQGLVNGTLYPYRPSGSERARATGRSALIGGVVGAVGMPLVGPLGIPVGALVGGAAGLAGSRWGQHFEPDKKKKPKPKAKTVAKARYFDPESDRQRQIGLAAGAAAGGAAVAGTQIPRYMTLDRVEGSKKANGIKFRNVKGARGRGSALLVGTGLLGAGAVGAYKHGISRRNQPWT
jgi:hypothetical protein